MATQLLRWEVHAFRESAALGWKQHLETARSRCLDWTTGRCRRRRCGPACFVGWGAGVRRLGAGTYRRSSAAVVSRGPRGPRESAT